MKHLRILGIALLALLALSAATAGLAAAEEGVLPPEPFTGKGGSSTLLNLNKEEWQCTSSEFVGKFLTGSEKAQHATGTFTCKGVKLIGFGANTLGDPAETVKYNLLYLFCLVNPTTLLFGILLLPLETIHVEVPALKALFLVKGATIGSLTKAGELGGTAFEVSFSEKDASTRAKCTLEAKEFTSTYEAGLDTKPDTDAFQVGIGTITFAKSIKFEDK